MNKFHFHHNPRRFVSLRSHLTPSIRDFIGEINNRFLRRGATRWEGGDAFLKNYQILMI